MQQFQLAAAAAPQRDEYLKRGGEISRSRSNAKRLTVLNVRARRVHAKAIKEIFINYHHHRLDQHDYRN